MVSTLSRLSELSTTPLMCRGRLLSPRCCSSASNSKPNLVAITTWSRTGARASPTFAHEFFVRVRPVRLGRVEEGDPALEGRPNERDHLLLVGSWAIPEAHAHAAESDGRDFQVAAKCSLLTCASFPNSIITSIASRSF